MNLMKVREGTIQPGESAFVGELAWKPDFEALAAAGVKQIHIVREGRPYCRRRVDWIDSRSEHRFIFYDRPKSSVMATPLSMMCRECYDPWMAEAFPTSGKKPRAKKTNGAAGDQTPSAKSAAPKDLDALLAELDAEAPPEVSVVRVRVTKAPAIEVRVAPEPERFDPPPDVTGVGWDPGFAKLGYLVVRFSVADQRLEVIDRGTIHTEAKEPDELRWKRLANGIEVVYQRHLPDFSAFERQATVGFEKRDRAAGKVARGDRFKLLRVVGMIEMAARFFNGGPCYEIATMTGRVAVHGKGKSRGATKRSTKDELAKRLGLQRVTLDEADAGAVVLAGYDRYRQPERERRKAALAVAKLAKKSSARKAARVRNRASARSAEDATS